MTTCALDGCERKRAHRNGLCQMHELRLQRNGDLLKRRCRGVMDFPMAERPVPPLSRREALLVRELARFPGRPVIWPILADAIGGDRYVVAHAVGRVRRKFGHGVIASTRGPQGGYVLVPGEGGGEQP